MPVGRLLEACSNVRPRGMIAGARGVIRVQHRTRLTDDADPSAPKGALGFCVSGFFFFGRRCDGQISLETGLIDRSAHRTVDDFALERPVHGARKVDVQIRVEAGATDQEKKQQTSHHFR